MLLLLSPAKTLDYTATDYPNASEARLLGSSDKLVSVLKKKSVRQLRKLMGISEDLARLNTERFQNYVRPFEDHSSKQAVLAFKGDVYIGLEASTFEEEDFRFAQKYLRILSGLYGVLRPLDLIYPYRLEMGTGLKVGRKKNLYEFWGDTITCVINEDLALSQSEYVINLASKEYFHAVRPAGLNAKLINIHFMEERNATLRVISFNAKKARGGMARQIILEKILNPQEIKQLTVDSYVFNSGMSSESDYYFIK